MTPWGDGCDEAYWRAAERIKRMVTECRHVQPCFTCMTVAFVEYEHRLGGESDQWAAFNRAIVDRMPRYRSWNAPKAP